MMNGWLDLLEDTLEEWVSKKEFNQGSMYVQCKLQTLNIRKKWEKI